MVPIRLDGERVATLPLQARYLLDTQPAATALVFITPDGQETITTSTFFQRAAQYAHALRSIGVQPGDLVVLVLPHSQDVLYSFWGAIMLGAIPSIFPFLTEKLHPDRYFDSIQKLVQRSGVRAVITYAELKPELDKTLTAIDGLLPLLLADDLQPSGDPNEFLDNPVSLPEQTAFLQHSSGTTGLQKGVMLSHRAVINQIASYSHAIRLQSNDVVCSWLPLYHDMGLIAGFIMPIMQGIPLVLMSPFHWVRAPHLLLQTIHRYQATLCWLPNFAYNMMALRIRDQHLDNQLDLSSMRALVNCSEPVRAGSHQVFYERFAPYGLQRAALTTCYAMAENTFAVTQGGIDRPLLIEEIDRDVFQSQGQAVPTNEDKTLSMVSCGTAIPGVEIQIVDDYGATLPDRHVGEIILRSDHMLSGYYQLPDVTADAIHDGWYYTGDLGYLTEGELFVSGRKKDLIIVGGKNIYPQDIEAIVNEIEGIKAGRTVAFGIFNDKLGTEDIGLVAEKLDGTDTSRIQRDIRQRVVQALDINVRYVHIVGPKWLIKTSSGKIARSANRDKYLQESRSL